MIACMNAYPCACAYIYMCVCKSVWVPDFLVCFWNWPNVSVHIYKCVFGCCFFLAILQRGGHTPTLHCINDRNVVELWVNGELVFQCDIRDLEYGEKLLLTSP